MKKTLFALILATVFLGPLPFPGESRGQPANKLVLGLSPYLSPATLLARFNPVAAYLSREAGVSLKDLGGFSFIGDQDKIVESVMKERFDAGTIAFDTFQRYPGSPLAVVAASGLFPERIFVASPSLDPALAERVRKAFLGMPSEVSRHISPASIGLRPIDEKDFGGIREILRKVEKDL